MREEFLQITNYIRLVKDHPRACGKNSVFFFTHSVVLGSPPRMREECQLQKTHEKLMRITPAHAGRISGIVSLRFPFRDHPRACGKNYDGVRLTQDNLGSPPRMREESHCTYLPNHSTGITPAHAGRMWSVSTHMLIAEDHPRACGKNSIISEYTIFRIGSPPRMREESGQYTCALLSIRITPAHAGRMYLNALYGMSDQDHPRACGKNQWLPV